MALVTEESLPLVEPVPIEDVAGIAARFVLYHTQTLYEVGTTVFVVKKKIILPYAVIPFGLKMTAEFMARRAGSGRMLQLVPPQ